MNMKRMRGRNHRPNNGAGSNNGGGGFRNQQNGIPLNRNHVFDSSGPEMRVRGTAQQLYEKYQQLARDASSNGDRVTGEAYYQHAEHYFRIISAINQAQGQPNPVPNGQQQPHVQNGQAPYQGNGQGNGQDRNGNQSEPRQNEAHSGQQNGYQNNQNRRYEQNIGNGERQQDLALEATPQAEPQRNENPPRQYEPRPQEPRRFEQRKSDFQRNERNNDRNNDRQERFRPETPMVDTRIDISSALEAELAAAVAEPVAPPPVLEARAIPIIPDAPPQSEPEAVADVPVRVAKPRGRPRAVKTAVKE